MSVILIITSHDIASDVLLQRIDSTLASLEQDYELIVVDDHASDELLARIQVTLQQGIARSRLIRLRNTHGYTAALRQALASARNPIIALMSGSLRYPPEALPHLLKQLATADLVIADGREAGVAPRWQTPYVAPHSGVHYALTPQRSKQVAQAHAALRQIDVDVESGLKVARREVFDRYLADLSDATFALDLLARALADGYRVTSVPVKAVLPHQQESTVLRQDLLLQALRLKMAQTTRATPLSAAERPQAEQDDRDLQHITDTLTLPVLAPPLDYLTPDQLPQRVRDEIARFSQRLAVDRTAGRSAADEARAAYTERAQQPFVLGATAYRPFAPITRRWSAAQTVTTGQKISIAVVVLILIALAIVAPLPTAGALIAVISVFYCVDLGVMFGLVAVALARPTAQVVDDQVARNINPAFWPSYTILCPLYREVEVVPQYVEAMRLLDYPQDRLQVLLLTEEDDRETRVALEAMALPPNFEIIVVPDGQPRTKPRACNYGLLQATGEYVVIYDAEDIPDPLQLKKAALAFANQEPNVACVQAKLNFYNPRQNLLTRWFTSEYSLWFDLTLPALQQTGTFLPLGGTSNHFRTEILRKVGGWDPFNVTEDCDLGVRLRQYRYATTMLDSTTYEEANPDLRNWLRQRSRWIKGYMQTYLIHMRQPWRYLREGRLSDFIWLQLFVGGRSATLLINPIMWLLLLLYVVARPFVAATYADLFPRFILYLAAGSLIFGNFLFLYAQLIGCIQRKQYSLAITTLFIPIYWALMSWASYIALYQLITKPHYWEKTQHGLHLRLAGKSSGKQPQRAPDTDLTDDHHRVATAVTGDGAMTDNAVADTDDADKASEIAFDQQVTTRLAAFHPISPALPPDAPAAVVAAVSAAVAVATAARRNIEALETLRLPATRRHSAPPQPQRLPPLSATESAYPSTTAQPNSQPYPRSSRWSKHPAEHTLPLTYIADMLSTVPVLPVMTPERTDHPSSQYRATVRALAATVSRPRQQRRRAKALATLRDGWLIATLVTAICASLVALWYNYTHNYIMLYNDAFSHLRIARSVLRGNSSGITQFGGVWLPLPHIIQLPFVWNDALWFSGLAGAFSSMPCYVIAAVYLFLTARRLTHNGAASFLGALVLMLNPNLLYLQTTPLTEPLLIATFVATGYYFVAWAQDDSLGSLILAGAAAFLATLTRYDGWPVYIACLVMIVVLGLIRRRAKSRIFGELTLFGSLGGLGIFLWFAWCQVIFGDALYFLHSPYSSGQQESTTIGAQGLFAAHSWPQSFFVYSVAAIETLGPIIFGLGVIGALAFVVPRWRNPGVLASLVFLTPYPFYVLVLYLGQDSIFVPGAVPSYVTNDLYNARFGIELLAPAALYIATLAHLLTTGVWKIGLRQWTKPRNTNAWGWADWTRTGLSVLLYGVIGFALIAQTTLTATGGVISLQDGQRGVSCAAVYPDSIFLVEHYNGGRLLDDTFHNSIHFEWAHIGFNSIIYEGSGVLWTDALAHPEQYVQWVVAAPQDLVTQHVALSSLTFTSKFILVSQDPDGTRLYHLRLPAPLPLRPAPTQLIASHALCRANVTAQEGVAGRW